MTNTEKMLFEAHRSPLLRLDAICEQWLGMKYEWASRKATLNTLPFPAFRLDESKKAPWMVRLVDLANYVDAVGQAAQESWELSQV